MPGAAAAPAARFTPSEIRVILSGVLLGMLLAALDQTIVATTLPAMAAELQGGALLPWVVSSYLLTSTATTPVYGKLSDRYGRRLMLQIAIVAFVAASVLCAMAGSMVELVVFRALQGLGGGGLFAMAHATIADIIAPRERGRYQGYIASVFAVASVAGPVLGGVLVEWATWRWAFWINLPIGLLALIISSRALRRLPVPGQRRPVDIAGAVLLVAAVSCLLLVLNRGGREAAWTSPVILGLAASGLVLFAVLVERERRAPEPILTPRLFRNPVYVMSSAISFLTAMGMIGAIVALPLYLQLAGGLGAGWAGLLMVPMTGGIVCGATLAGRLVAATGRYKRYPVIGLVASVLGFALLSGPAAQAGHLAVAGAMTVLGFGFGMVLPTMLVAIQNAVEGRDIGIATSSVSFFRSLGGAFGVALFQAVLAAGLDARLAVVPEAVTLGPEPGLALIDGGPALVATLPPVLRGGLLAAVGEAFQPVFLLGAGMAALAGIAAMMLKELPLRAAPHAAAASPAVPEG